jgi:hypothetical protein
LTPIHAWKTRWLVVPNTFSRHSMTSQSSTPSVRNSANIPGAPVPSRSVQNGASTLLGRAGSGNVCGTKSMSALVPPPTTRYPFDVTPRRVYAVCPYTKGVGRLKLMICSSPMGIGVTPNPSSGM